MEKPGRDRLSCDEALRRLDDFLDRALTPSELARVEHHLADCLACAAAARFEAGVIARVRERLHRIAAPPALLDTILARLRAEPTR